VRRYRSSPLLHSRTAPDCPLFFDAIERGIFSHVYITDAFMLLLLLLCRAATPPFSIATPPPRAALYAAAPRHALAQRYRLLSQPVYGGASPRLRSAQMTPRPRQYAAMRRWRHCCFCFLLAADIADTLIEARTSCAERGTMLPQIPPIPRRRRPRHDLSRCAHSHLLRAIRQRYFVSAFAAGFA